MTVTPRAGVWIDTGEDTSSQTPRDEHVSLGPGDLLLLHADDLIEARNAGGEESGIERVQSLLHRWRRSPWHNIYERLLSTARDWMPVQQDDITLIVVRQSER